MSCYSGRHAFTRSGTIAVMPHIGDGERCDCGLFTMGELREMERKAADPGRAALQAVVTAARAVVSWDWSDNDEDCVRDVDALRDALDALDKVRP
jgi:hypothetical protein